MKKILLIASLFIGVACFTSCDKDDDVAVDPIVGTWELDSEGEVNGTAFTNLWKWEFNEDNSGSYSFTANDVVEESSDFTWSISDSVYHINYVSDEIEDVDAYIEDFLGETCLFTTEDEMMGAKTGE